MPNIRSEYIGGSDIAAVCGVSKYKTMYEVWSEKVIDNSIQAIPEKDNDYMYWGRKFEPLIIEEFKKKKNVEVIDSQLLVQHKDLPFLAGHIDGFIPSENAILECKASARGVDFKEEGSDDIPMDYLFQVAYYCYLKQVSKAYIAVLIAGHSFKIYQYVRNEKLEQLIKEKAITFWKEYVLPKLPPYPSSFEEVKKIYSIAIAGQTSVATPDIEALYYETIELTTKQKELEKTIDYKKMLLFNFMKDSEILVDNAGDKLCTAKNISSNAFNSKAFKEAHPDLYKQFLISKNYRRFLINQPNEA